MGRTTADLMAETLYRGVANLGVRPTVAEGKPERLLELHLFDLDAEIYGEELEVRFLRYLRSERKFADVDALKMQIAADVRQARPAGSAAAQRGTEDLEARNEIFT